MSKKIDYVAYAITTTSDKKGRWREIGVSFINRDDSITVLVDAAPLSGKIILRKPEPKEEGLNKNPSSVYPYFKGR